MAKNRHKKENTVNNAKSNTVNNGLASALGLPCGGYRDYSANSPYLLFQHASQFLLTFDWLALTGAYNKNGFLQTAVNQMVEDAFRNDGLIINTKSLTTAEIEKLRETMDDEGDIDAIIDCIRWGRLYGGGVLIANTDQNFELPLDEKQLRGKKLKFLATNRWQCIANGISPEIAPSFLLTDNLAADLTEEQRTGITIDTSRVGVFIGRKAPYQTRAILQGWNTSIFEGVLEPINQLLGAFGVTLELLSEAKIDIFKIEGLSNLLISPDGERQVRKRLEIATENKNYKGSLAMDNLDTYEQKQISFSGIPDLLNQLMFIFCGYLRYPVSKLFGKGSSGFSSGEDDLENYNGNVDSDIRTPARKLIKWVVDLRCLQLFGRTLPDFRPQWKPLRVMSEKDQAEINSRRLADYLQLFDRRIMNGQQVAEHLTEDGYILYSPEEISNIDDEDFRPDEYEKVEDLLID